LRRIAREQQVLVRAFSTFSDFEPDGLAFDLPSTGRVSGGFGPGASSTTSRASPIADSISPLPRNRYRRARRGAGAGDRRLFFNGLSVVLDHGQAWSRCTTT